jgi:hypothetical protein
MVMPAPGAVKSLPRRHAPIGLFRRDTARPVTDHLCVAGHSGDLLVIPARRWPRDEIAIEIDSSRDREPSPRGAPVFVGRR